MKNILKINILMFLAATLIFSSCEEFLDVNDNPTQVSEDEVTLSILLPTTIEATSSAHYSMAYTTNQATHHLDAFNGYYTDFALSGAWSTIYLKSLTNLKVLASKAKANGSNDYLGAAKVLEALNLGLLTDTWENVPYSAALQGEDNFTPAYDAQANLYSDIISLLDEALAAFAKEDSFLSPGSDDLAYGGERAKWVRLANSLKARYMIHQLNKSGVDYNAILATIDSSMVDNSDNFQLTYNEANPNPWFTNVAKANETGNFSVTQAKYFVDLLKGDIYDVVDPRLDLLVEKSADATEYIGEASWLDVESTVLITPNLYHAKEAAPILMVTYAEVKFIEAEAALITGDMARARTAYEAGITANMQMLGVAQADIDAYLADPAVDVVDVEHVMKEKYIALYLQPEAWTDMRRHHYSPDVYKDFVEPSLNGRDTPGQRARYPETEENRNGANVSANRKGFTELMWRDM